MTTFLKFIELIDLLIGSSQDYIPDCLQKTERCCDIVANSFTIVDYGSTEASICDISQN